MQPFLRFLSYNNTVPIALTILLSGAGATFAATNPESIYDSAQSVVVADNTYIANKDLSSFTPRILIMGVTEDADNYYVAYALTTIDVVDAVWRDVVKEGVLTVSKGVLGEYGDLGLYATEQFKQIVDSQLAYLREVQEIERKQVTQKIVATSYSGLIGQFLDESTEVLPGYVPVVTPPSPPEPIVEATPQPDTEGQQDPENELPQPNPEDPSSNEGGAAVGTSTPSDPLAAPQIQILGDNPVELSLNASYVDLGIVATDDSGAIPQIKKYVDGVEISDQVVIDTSLAGEHVIRYVATDVDGNSTSAERLIRVLQSESEPVPDPETDPVVVPVQDPVTDPVVEPVPEAAPPVPENTTAPQTQTTEEPPAEAASTPVAE